jgi:integrase
MILRLNIKQREEDKMNTTQKENTAVGTAARFDNPALPGFGDMQVIAVMVVNAGYVPHGATDGSSARLPEQPPVTLTLHQLTANLGARFGFDAIPGMAAFELPKIHAEGMAAVEIERFADYLRSDRAEKTAQGYYYDVRNVLTTISEGSFGDLPLEKLDLAMITAAQVKQAEQKLFKVSDLKPATLARVKQGWNRFCLFVGMKEWKFTEKINAEVYSDEVIFTADVLKMLEYCRQQREISKTTADRIRWYRKEIALRLGFEMGFRSCEYGNATFGEVDNRNRITIKHSKANGYREVSVTKETKSVIMEFRGFLIERNAYPESGRVFEKTDGKGYSTSTFRRWIRATAKACGIAANLAKTHGLRHRFARNFGKHTPNQMMLSRIMGHKSIKTTMQYAEPTFEDMQDAIQASVDSACANLLRAA